MGSVYGSFLVTTIHFWLKQQWWQLLLCLRASLSFPPSVHDALQLDWLFVADTPSRDSPVSHILYNPLFLSARGICHLLLTSRIWHQWWAVTPFVRLLSADLSISIYSYLTLSFLHPLERCSLLCFEEVRWHVKGLWQGSGDKEL